MKSQISFGTAVLIIVVFIALLIAMYYIGLGEALPRADRGVSLPEKWAVADACPTALTGGEGLKERFSLRRLG